MARTYNRGMDRSARVLVVDDSEDVRELYKLVLVAEGYEVATAGDGERGFQTARTWRPDLIVLDVVMPCMDGLQLLLKLRSDLPPPIPPVILCSGFDLTEQEALRRGAAAFLRKPIDVEDLLGAVTGALEGRAVTETIVGQQHDRAAVARQRVLAAARERVDRLEKQGVPSMKTFEVLAHAKIATVAAYLAIPRGALALVRDRKLSVLAATDDAALPIGFDLGHALPQAYEVLETGSSLLLPDASAHPYAAVARALGGIRFFAGVPLIMDGGTPVGVICVFDPGPRRIDTEELAALQLFGRRGSDILVRFAALGDATRLIRHGEGVVVNEVFEQLLDAELRILARKGGAMELAVVDVSDVNSVSAAITRAPHRERLMAGALGSARVAVYKRSLDGSATAQLAALLDELRKDNVVCEVGVVDVLGSGVRGLDARDLVYIASTALDRSIEHGGELRRVVIEERAG